MGTVIGLRKDRQFVEEVNHGEDCGVLLDQTSFYAESGGQIFDEGFMEKEGDTVRNSLSRINGALQGRIILNCHRRWSHWSKKVTIPG